MRAGATPTLQVLSVFQLVPEYVEVLNLITQLTYLIILVYSTVGLQSWFGYVMDSALKRSCSLHSTEWLASLWDPGQPEGVRKYSVVVVFTYTRSGNAEVQETTELIGMSVYGEFMRKRNWRKGRFLQVIPDERRKRSSHSMVSNKYLLLQHKSTTIIK